eukprot:SAG31_NODE_463_length_15332_cov_5.907700_5_plen_172_part_00
MGRHGIGRAAWGRLTICAGALVLVTPPCHAQTCTTPSSTVCDHCASAVTPTSSALAILALPRTRCTRSVSAHVQQHASQDGRSERIRVLILPWIGYISRLTEGFTLYLCRCFAGRLRQYHRDRPGDRKLRRDGHVRRRLQRHRRRNGVQLRRAVRPQWLHRSATLARGTEC